MMGRSGQRAPGNLWRSATVPVGTSCKSARISCISAQSSRKSPCFNNHYIYFPDFSADGPEGSCQLPPELGNSKRSVFSRPGSASSNFFNRCNSHQVSQLKTPSRPSERHFTWFLKEPSRTRHRAFPRRRPFGGTTEKKSSRGTALRGVQLSIIDQELSWNAELV